MTRDADAAGFHHYRRDDDSHRPANHPRGRLLASVTPKNWFAIASSLAGNLDEKIKQALSSELREPIQVFDAFPLIGFNPKDRAGPCWTFPEMDSAGNIVGIMRRFPKGKGPGGKDKLQMKGGHRGLTLPIGWREIPGAVFVVEGASDTLAMTGAGLSCIGRPSADGGAEFLAELIRDLPPERTVIVVGENDRKPGGEWPGRDAAKRLSRRLSATLRRSIGWALPPEIAKDVRDWLTAEARGAQPWNQRGADLCAALAGAAEVIDQAESAGSAGNRTPSEEPNDAPDNPHRLAAGYLDSITPAASPRLLRFWRGEFHRFRGGAYRPVPDDDQRGELTQYVRCEFVRLNAVAVAAFKDKGNDEEQPPRVRPVTSRLIGDVLQALRGLCLLSADIDTPAWIDGGNGPDPAALLPVRNGILDLGALVKGRGRCLLPLSPLFFSPTAAPFDFDPNAAAPKEWLGFLREVWPNDPQSIDALQEWFGYLLTPDTRQQKILFLLGPRRAGKGTITRVLRELVGPANVAGPTLGSLSTNFGLWPLLGKSVAVISDARLSARSDSAVITERLLAISGEDALTIDRKHRTPLTAKLNTRFVIVSNELPRLGDASGALSGRLILLHLTRTWFGREDHHLFDRLRGELPGILLWAVEGWRRLRDRGRFVQPQSAADLVEDMEDLSSPVGSFVRERCRVATGERIEVGELYREWRSWCETHGRKEPGTEETFGRDLRAAAPTITKARPRTPEGRLHFYTGIRLRRDSDPDEEPAPGGHSGHRGPPLHAWAGRGVESVRAEGAEEDRRAEEAATPGHGDQGDHPDRPRRAPRPPNLFGGLNGKVPNLPD